MIEGGQRGGVGPAVVGGAPPRHGRRAGEDGATPEEDEEATGDSDAYPNQSRRG
jgi:hypothetical protein